MTFEEILDQAIDMLRRRGRLTYGALKRQFDLDDAYLEDLKDELIEGQRLAVDEQGRVLVWIGERTPAAAPAQRSCQSSQSWTLNVVPCPTRHPTWLRRFSPRAVPSKASVSRFPCYFAISPTPPLWPSVWDQKPCTAC